MADKYIPTEIDNLQSETTAVNTINNNLSEIADQFDNTLSRDGTGPNEMQSSLDMNSHRIINLPAPRSPTDVVRLQDLPVFSGEGGAPGDGDGGIGNGILGHLYFDLNTLGESRLRVIPNIDLDDPQAGDTTNPGGYKTTNFMFWNRIPSGTSKTVGWWNIDVEDLEDPAVVSAKHSIYGLRLFSYNRVQAGTADDGTGLVFHEQEVGPLSISGVTASGNTTGKTEGIVCFVSHEDDTADGKLVSAQFGTVPKGRDPGRDEIIEDDDGDSSTPGPAPAYILRLNMSGTTRGYAAIMAKSGKKLGGHLPFYNGYAVGRGSVYQGDRDDSYDVSVPDDPLPGRSFVHFGTSAINGWGWIGLGTDDPKYHIDVRSSEPSEIVDFTAQNLDEDPVNLLLTNRTIFRNRVFGNNDNAFTTEMARATVNIVDPSHGAEDSAWVFSTVTAGVLGSAFKMGAGAWAGTGGDPGVNALGADQLKINTVGGFDTAGKLRGTLSASVKAAIAAAADVAALKTALAGLFA